MRPSPSATLASVDDLSGIRGDSTGMMRDDQRQRALGRVLDDQIERVPRLLLRCLRERRLLTIATICVVDCGLTV